MPPVRWVSDVVIGTEEAHALPRHHGARAPSRCPSTIPRRRPGPSSPTTTSSPSTPWSPSTTWAPWWRPRRRRRLGLRHNPPDAVAAARDKLAMRTRLAAMEVPQPAFAALPAGSEPRAGRRRGELGRAPVRDQAHDVVGQPGSAAGRHPRRGRRRSPPVSGASPPTRASTPPRPSSSSGSPPGPKSRSRGSSSRASFESWPSSTSPTPSTGPAFEETIYVTPSRLAPGDLAAVLSATRGRHHGTGAGRRAGPRRGARARRPGDGDRGGGAHDRRAVLTHVVVLHGPIARGARDRPRLGSSLGRRRRGGCVGGADGADPPRRHPRRRGRPGRGAPGAGGDRRPDHHRRGSRRRPRARGQPLSRVRLRTRHHARPRGTGLAPGLGRPRRSRRGRRRPRPCRRRSRRGRRRGRATARARHRAENRRSDHPRICRYRGAVHVVLVSTYELGHQPLHVASPARALLRAGHDVRCADLAVDPFDVDLLSWADAVAFSVPMHTAMRLARPACRQIRSRRPDIALCLYGLYAGLDGAEGFAPVADLAVAGEYEPGLVAWADSLSDADVASPSQARTGSHRRRARAGPVRASRPPPPAGLDRYARLALGRERRLAGYVEASHGCAHRCRHCPVPVVYDGRTRLVGEDAVVADVAQLVGHGSASRHLRRPRLPQRPAPRRRG